MEEGPAIKWLWSGGQESCNYGELLWCTLAWFFTFRIDIPSLGAAWQAAISPFTLTVVYSVVRLFTWQQRQKGSARNKPSSFSEAGRKALPLACRCLSERKARRPGARCPLSVHTLPSAASCFVTQHDSMGHRDGGALRSTADQLTWIKRNFLY